MFVMCGISLAWTALTCVLTVLFWYLGWVTPNLGWAGARWGWAALSLFQVFLAVQPFRIWGRAKLVQTDWRVLQQATGQPTPAPSFAERPLPFVGCALSPLALLGVLVWYMLSTFDWSVLTGPGWGLAIDWGVLGLAGSLTALSASYRHETLSFLGLVCSSGALLAYLLLFWVLARTLS